jgi:KDO2-lipid IV(A) lauroyltransferase
MTAIWFSAAAGSNRVGGLNARKSWLQVQAEYATATSLIALLRALPISTASRTAEAAMRVLDLSLPRLRRIARINLSFALPSLSAAEHERIIDGVFRSLARLLLSMAKFPDINAANVSQWIQYQGLENYQAAKAKQRGVLVATAHLGNWELSAFAHALMTEPMNVMVRPLDNPGIDRIVETRRELSGNRLIHKHRSARSVLQALKNNEAVGILIDQNTSAAEGVFIQFFGKAACAGSAFAKLAYHSEAAIIPGFALWDSAAERYILRFYPEVPMSGDEQADTQRIHTFIESVIREYPDQWMWIHRRWKTRPEGEPMLY